MAGVTFSDSGSTPVPKFLNLAPDPGATIFKFENPTPVQNPDAIIDPTEIFPCFYLRDDHTDSCYCRNRKMTLASGLFFYKFLTPDPGPKEKGRILPESTPALRLRPAGSGFKFF